MLGALWFFINLFQVICVVAWTSLWVTLALLALLFTFDRSIPLSMARRIWAPGLLWLSGAKLNVTGLENIDLSRSHVYVANHESMIDIVAVFAAIPQNIHFVLKKELKKVPFVGWFAQATGMIFVDRKNTNTAIANLKQVARLIADGRSVIAFPEGTRSRGRGIQRFKKGVFVAAIEAKVPVIPVAIIGAEKVLPSDGFNARPGTIHIRFGEPISTRRMSIDDRDRLPETARDQVIELHSPSNRSERKKPCRRLHS